MKRILSGLLAAVVIAGAGYIGYHLKGNNNQSAGTGTSSNQSNVNGKTVDYSGRGLSEFPKAVFSDASITTLYLSNNNLTGTLPAEIHNLVNLQVLDVSNNKMTGIPAEIGQLKHLKTLDYSNNRITGLPMELGNLTQLQVLDLRGNNVSQQDLLQVKSKLLNTQIKL